nr:glucose-6-phosphate/phosphate translocator 2, chloroplastic-like [Tanacetum cinerariifolium]
SAQKNDRDAEKKKQTTSKFEMNSDKRNSWQEHSNSGVLSDSNLSIDDVRIKTFAYQPRAITSLFLLHLVGRYSTLSCVLFLLGYDSRLARGCALSAVTELNFNMIGFMGAMISNLAFVFRNIFSKRGMKGKSVSGMNYYACLSMLSLLILTPFTFAMEGPQMWEAGLQTALTQVGPNIIWWVVAQSVFYHLYNQVSYMSLDQISPLTFSVGNTMKRISVIVSSIIIFRTPVQPVNALGAAIAILGTFIYSQSKP